MLALNAYCLEWHLTHSRAFQDFLVEPLKPFVDIQLVAWENMSGNADAIAQSISIFCQVQPPAEWLAQPRARIVWLPMLDNVIGYPQTWWHNFPPHLRVVAFSDHVEQCARAAGLPVLRLQYFINPAKFAPVDWTRGRILFYWNRTGLASVDLLARVCQAARIHKLILLDQPDPGFASLPLVTLKARLPKVEIETVPAFLPRAAYWQAIESANLFIAPRVFEGVGMTFLEALARGCAVLASDTPTMNEYITHRADGYIFRPRGKALAGYRRAQMLLNRLTGATANNFYAYTVPAQFQNWTELNRTDFEALGQSARARHLAGYALWQKQIEAYAHFVLDW